MASPEELQMLQAQISALIVCHAPIAIIQYFQAAYDALNSDQVSATSQTIPDIYQRMVQIGMILPHWLAAFHVFEHNQGTSLIKDLPRFKPKTQGSVPEMTAWKVFVTWMSVKEEKIDIPFDIFQHAYYWTSTPKVKDLCMLIPAELRFGHGDSEQEARFREIMEAVLTVPRHPAMVQVQRLEG